MLILDLPDYWLEQLPDNPNKISRMNQEQGLQVFLVLPVERLVGLIEKVEFRFVL